MTPKQLHDALLDIKSNLFTPGHTADYEAVRVQLERMLKATAPVAPGRLVGVEDVEVTLTLQLCVTEYTPGYSGRGEHPDEGPQWSGYLALDGYPVLHDLDPYMDEDELNEVADQAWERAA